MSVLIDPTAVPVPDRILHEFIPEECLSGKVGLIACTLKIYCGFNELREDEHIGSDFYCLLSGH